MRITILSILTAMALALGCQSTQEAPEPDENGEVVIPPDDLEPMRDLIMDTRRVLASEFVLIEASIQLFEQQIGFVSDPAYVQTERGTVLPDGTKITTLRNVNPQQTNINPDLLPRVTIGGPSGLEIRAFNTIVIKLKPSRDKLRPLFITVDARSKGINTRMWVNGRLQYDKPTIRIESALLWDEERGRYVHRAHVG